MGKLLNAQPTGLQAEWGQNPLWANCSSIDPLAFKLSEGRTPYGQIAQRSPIGLQAEWGQNPFLANFSMIDLQAEWGQNPLWGKCSAIDPLAFKLSGGQNPLWANCSSGGRTSYRQIAQ